MLISVSGIMAVAVSEEKSQEMMKLWRDHEESCPPAELESPVESLHVLLLSGEKLFGLATLMRKSRESL